MLAVIANY